MAELDILEVTIENDMIDPSGNLKNSEKIRQLLADKGYCILRNRLANLTAFEQFTRNLCPRFHSPSAREFLRDRQGDGFTTQVPAVNFELFVHSEGAYRPVPQPDICFFYCVKPIEAEGGETILVDGVQMVEQLSPELRQKLQRHGVIYCSDWDEDRWRTEFKVANTIELANVLDQFQHVSYRAEANNRLYFECHRAAIFKLSSGEKAFVTGVLAHLHHINHPAYTDQWVYSNEKNNVLFGNGEPLTDEEIIELIGIQDRLAIAHQWQERDLLLIDNKRFMHGRRSTLGESDRQIYSRFGYLQD